MYKIILLFFTIFSITFANDVYAWFYSCNVEDNKYLLNNSFMTGVFPWCNNYLYNKWQWNTPYKELHNVVDQFHKQNIKVYPSITNSPNFDYKSFLRNETTKNRLINYLINISEEFNVDGYNLDLEYGGYNYTDEELYSEFVLNLMKKLKEKNKKLSICIGNLKNGNILSNKFNDSNLLIIDMDTYTSSITGFLFESLKLSLFNKSNIGIGLSAATTSWKNKPNKTELDRRFYILNKLKFKSISLFGNDWFYAYQPYLYKFKNNIIEL